METRKWVCPLCPCPTKGWNTKELLDPDKDSLLSNWYQVDADRIYTRTDTVHRDDLIQKQSAIVDGVGFMKALLHQMEWQRNTTLQNIRGGSVLDHRRVTFRWEEEDAVMERKTLRDINSRHPIFHSETCGLTLGMVDENERWNIELGSQSRTFPLRQGCPENDPCEFD